MEVAWRGERFMRFVRIRVCVVCVCLVWRVSTREYGYIINLSFFTVVWTVPVLNQPDMGACS